MDAPKHTTREAFFDQANWLTSKKGNAYIRDHQHTYTIKFITRNLPAADLQEMWVVAVRFDGERTDFGPFHSTNEMIEALWPADATAPKGVP